MTIQDLLSAAIKQKASDLHLIAGYSPALRIDGDLEPLYQTEILNGETISALVKPLLNPQQTEVFERQKELDFACEIQNVGRFRVNLYLQQGRPSAAFRHLPYAIRTLDELNLPQNLNVFLELKQGFVLVTGPTGQGKTTTLASLINYLNLSRPIHIITIEDPVEYIFPKAKAMISQRELGFDTLSWPAALRAALREDPDVVLIGEMRDYETISTALTVAETGHLVFASLHTNSAAQTIDRIIDVFPENAKSQVRFQLSATLEGIVSQRLVPALGGGRLPAVEILLATPAVRSNIREGKTHQIDNIIQTSSSLGMQTLEESLAFWVKQGKVELEIAERFAANPREVVRAAKGAK